jgi:hypothetical protein
MATPTKRFNISAGKAYTTRDGQEKKSWINIGRATQWDDGGISLEFTSIPVGNWWDGRASLFEQDENKEQGQARQRPQRSAPQDDSENVPF